MPRRALAVALVLSLVMAPLAGTAEQPREVRVLADGTNLRAQPSLTGRVLKQLPKGQLLRVVEDAGEWYLVAGQDQFPGYVNKRLVETVAPPVAQPTPPPAAPPVAAPPPPEAGGAPAISHAPLTCVRVEESPLLFADVTSPKTVQKSRVYFKAHQHPDWYYVDMKASELPHYLTFLPQPLPQTEKVDYYLQAFDAALDTSRTDQYEPAVSRKGCRQEQPRDLRVDRREAMQLTLGGTKPGQAPIPPGFSRKGIAAFVTVTGAVITGAALLSTGGTAVAAGATAGAGGGGISGTTLALVGGGLAAAGVGVAAAAGGKAEPSPPAPPLVTGNLTGSTQPWSETVTNLVSGCVNRSDMPACALQVTLTDNSGQAIIVCGPSPWVNLSGPQICDVPDQDKIPGSAQTYTFSQLTVSGASVTGVTFSEAHQTLTLQATRDTSTLRGTITWNGATATTPNVRWGGGQQAFTASKP